MTNETVSDAVAQVLVSLSNLPTPSPYTARSAVPADESVPTSPSSDVRNMDYGSFVTTKDEVHTGWQGALPEPLERGRASTGSAQAGFPGFSGLPAGLMPSLQQMAVIDAKARLASAPSAMSRRPGGNWRRRKIEDAEDEDDEKRKMSHNMVERRRRNIINDNLSELQCAIPQLSRAGKASKASIIRGAIDHIYELTDENARWRAHADRLDRENAMLRDQLQRTCTALVGKPTLLPYAATPATPAASPPPCSVEREQQDDVVSMEAAH